MKNDYFKNQPGGFLSTSWQSVVHCSQLEGSAIHAPPPRRDTGSRSNWCQACVRVCVWKRVTLSFPRNSTDLINNSFSHRHPLSSWQEWRHTIAPSGCRELLETDITALTERWCTPTHSSRVMFYWTFHFYMRRFELWMAGKVTRFFRPPFVPSPYSYIRGDLNGEK